MAKSAELPPRKLQLVLFWGGLLVGLLWTLCQLLANQGWILDDELSHYLFSKSVWVNPDKLLDLWTRPGRNLLQFWVTPLGFTATRLYTLGLAVISLVLTLKVGKGLGLKAMWALPIFFLFQSWFPELSYPVLTQTPFMLMWILGIYFAQKQQWHRAGFCFGYLSLVRHEGILLSGLWGLWISAQEGVVRQFFGLIFRQKCELSWGESIRRDVLRGLSTLSPILIFNLIAVACGHKLPFATYFEGKPTTLYGSGTIYHYVPLLIGGLGMVSFAFSWVGVWAIRRDWKAWSLLLATYPMYFIMHSLIYWRGAYASGGYYHFLMPMAPFFALLGVAGMGYLAEKRWSEKTRGWAMGVILLAVSFQGVNMQQRQMSGINWERIAYLDEQGEEAKDPNLVERRSWTEWAYSAKRHLGYGLFSNDRQFGLVAGPILKDEVCSKIMEASAWVRQEFPEAPVSCRHIAFAFEREILSTPDQIRLAWAKPDDLSRGSIFIWESKYAENQDMKSEVGYDVFKKDRKWREVRSWTRDYPMKKDQSAAAAYHVVVFEKFRD